jgi:hypothetical protein
MYETEHIIIRKGPLPLERNGYQWPASALGSREMELLYLLRQETGIPINRLLALCVLYADIKAIKKIANPQKSPKIVKSTRNSKSNRASKTH